MQHLNEAPSAGAGSASSTSDAELDRAVARVAERRQTFARLGPAEKALLLRSTLPLFLEVAEDWVKAACTAKGLSADRPVAGEEWLAGPVVTLRNARLLLRSLEQIAQSGRPSFGEGVRRRSTGRTEVEVMPAGGLDPILHRGLSCTALLEAGVDEATARERQASFYQRRSPEGRVSLILGAGNVSSIPPSDVLYKMFVEGSVAVLKVNPVNEWVGPMLERALSPLISRQFLSIVYGGADVGSYLCQHPGVDDIHITGSNQTHDRIVWGPPGPEQDRRRRENDPVLKKTITSELGNVSPVAIVPGNYSDDALWFQARNVATMVVNNASFNCNAAKILVTARAWPQRQRFLDMIVKALGEVLPRRAYYPGAKERYAELVDGREGVVKVGTAGPDELPWTVIPGVDSSRPDPLFQIEPFCAVITETDLDEADPAAFLQAVTRFCNDRLWGTLNAMLVIDPRTESGADVARALEQAILDLRYGTVCINHWPGLVFGCMSAPWGGHPSATLADVQSGIGWAHNTYMLEGVEKSIFRGPITMSPKPAWFYDNKMTSSIARKLTDIEAFPSVLKVPALALTAMRG
jgi:acyl-CoA reductase-like NAD-dependent aldehyde dehydrogenase